MYAGMIRCKTMLVAATVLVSSLASSGCFFAGGAGKEPSRLAQAKYDLANEAFQHQRYREALDYVKTALEEQSDHAAAAYLGAMVMLVFCAQDEQSPDCRYPAAERYLRLALKSEPDMREARNALGVTLVHRGKYREAIATLEPLTRDILYRSPEKAWGNLGWAQWRAGEVDEALISLRRSVAAQPLFCVGHYRLGLVYEKKGESGAAHRSLTRALEIDQGGCQRLQAAFRARARVALALGKRAEARQDLQRCEELAAATKDGQACRHQLQSEP